MSNQETCRSYTLEVNLNPDYVLYDIVPAPIIRTCMSFSAFEAMSAIENNFSRTSIYLDGCVV
jgi:hypothetical protein